MADRALQVHVIADSTGESGARVARAVLAQFPNIETRIIRHARVTTSEAIFAIFDKLRESRHVDLVVMYTLVSSEMRRLVALCCTELDIPSADLMGGAVTAVQRSTGQSADEAMMRPVGVEADYFVRIAAMEFAVRNDDGSHPEALRDCDICLTGPSRSGKTPLSIYLGYLGYKTANVPLVKGIAAPAQLFEMPTWRVVGLTIDPEHLLSIRAQRVSRLGGFGAKDGYAELAAIYDELDEIKAIHRRLGVPVINTTNLALEEAASLVIDFVERRAKAAQATLRNPANNLQMKP